MKEHYTDFEQKMVKYFYDHRGEVIEFYTFLVDHMEAVAIELLKDHYYAIIYKTHFEQMTKSSTSGNKYTTAEKSVIEIIWFIEYLIKNDLITIFSYGNNDVNRENTIRIFDKKKYKYREKRSDSNEEITVRTAEEFMAAFADDSYTRIEEGSEAVLTSPKIISQYSIYDCIERFLTSIIYPSSILIELFKNEFKTPEQRRFERLKRVTWVGIGVAVGIGLIGILLNIIALRKDSNISPTQIERIQTTIQENKVVIPATINTNITNDTLKVDVVKTIPNKR